MIDMQAKPLLITISAEKGRDKGVNKALKHAIEAIEDYNPHLTFHKAEVRTNGDITEINAWLRVSRETDQ